jgi:hypothetical protein
MTFKVPSRCAHCGRPLKNGGQIVLGLELGSECVNKFAGLAAYLEQHEITIGSSYPMVPNAQYDGFTINPDLLTLKSRAALAGVRLEIKSHFGAMTPHDEVVGVKSADPARFATATEIRTTFETSLERAS